MKPPRWIAKGSPNHEDRLARAIDNAPNRFADQVWAIGNVRILVSGLNHSYDDIEDSSDASRCALGMGAVETTVGLAGRSRVAVESSDLEQIQFACRLRLLEFDINRDVLNLREIVTDNAKRQVPLGTFQFRFAVKKGGRCDIPPPRGNLARLQFHVQEHAAILKPDIVGKEPPNMSNDDSTNGKGNVRSQSITINNSTLINTSFEDVNKMDASPTKDAVLDLTELVRKLVDRLAPSDADAAAGAASQLRMIADQAQLKNPDKEQIHHSGKRLIAYAKSVAELALPIAKTVETIFKLFGISTAMSS